MRTIKELTDTEKIYRRTLECNEDVFLDFSVNDFDRIMMNREGGGTREDETFALMCWKVVRYLKSTDQKVTAKKVFDKVIEVGDILGQ